MASGNSRSGLLTKRGQYSPTGTDENITNGDIELQERVPQKQKPTRQQSYENMDERDFSEDVCHQYEEPVDIRSRNRETGSSRQDPNNAAENTQNKRGKKAGETADCTDGNRHRALPGGFKILAFAGFLLTIVAIILVVLLMAGAVPSGKCNECKKDLVLGHDASKSSETSQRRLWKVIKELKTSMGRLNSALKKRDETILDLQMQDLELDGKIAELQRKASYRVFVFNGTTFNISNYQGPQTGVKGDTGLDGRTGKIGSGNMTLCRYMSEESVPFTVDESSVGNVIVTEQEGYRIIGATCSTVGASEYNLKSQINSNNFRQYECECRGKSTLFAAKGGGAKCILHYWQCEPYY